MNFVQEVSVDSGLTIFLLGRIALWFGSAFSGFFAALWVAGPSLCPRGFFLILFFTYIFIFLMRDCILLSHMHSQSFICVHINI